MLTFPFSATEYVCHVLSQCCVLTRPIILIAIFENYVAEIRLDGKAVQLALWDTAYVALPYLPPYFGT
jgi:hypothetical protein